MAPGPWLLAHGPYGSGPIAHGPCAVYRDQIPGRVEIDAFRWRLFSDPQPRVDYGRRLHGSSDAIQNPSTLLISARPPSILWASKIDGRRSSSGISVRDGGEGGEYALFNANVKDLFTDLNLSWPITCIFAKSQIAAR